VDDQLQATAADYDNAAAIAAEVGRIGWWQMP